MRFNIDVSQITAAYRLVVCCAGIVCLCSDLVKVCAKDCRHASRLAYESRTKTVGLQFGFCTPLCYQRL